MECLGCGCATVKGDRRILSNFTTLQSVWKNILVSDFEIDESLIEYVTKEYVYMCTKCYKQYDKLITLYSNIKTSLSAVFFALIL